MLRHELKIWPQFYKRVADGSKTFEVRQDDRGFQSGDIVVLKEYDPTPINQTSNAPKGYTGSPDLEFKIGYMIYRGGGEVIFSILPIKKAAEKKAKKQNG